MRLRRQLHRFDLLLFCRFAKAVLGSDKKNNMVFKGGCFGYGGGRAVVNRGGSSTNTSSLPGGKKKKTDGQLFGKRQLKLSTSSLLLPESPS